MATVLKNRATDITAEFCRERGIKALLLDVDNTLALHGDPTPLDGVVQWVNEMRKNSIITVIVSNNNENRVAAFSAKLGIPYVANAAKPLPLGIRKAMALCGTKRNETVLVGDQMFTDLLGAKCSGIGMILLEPIEEEKSGFLKVKRRADNFLRKFLFRR